MLPPVQSLPFRTQATACHALQLHERAAHAYGVALSSLSSAPPEFRKTRALSQQPTALERVMHQIVRMRYLGATIADLRAIPLQIESLLNDLERPVAHGRLAALLRETKMRQHEGDIAELDALLNTQSPRELHRFAQAARAGAAVELEAANEADREARALETMHS